jgi:hypothetical protein
MEAMELSDAENPTEAPIEQGVKEAEEFRKTQTPTATGTEKIEILKHNLSVRVPIGDYLTPAGLDLAIRNISDSVIATAVFEAAFYDQEGNIVEQVRHAETTLEPKTSRAIHIASSPYEDERVKSYAVRVIRTATSDAERVQLRRHEMRATETGEEEIMGIAKNISQVKTDVAVIATFYDAQEEIIGTKVVVLRDVEPNTIRQYELRFKPQEGDEISRYTLRIGEIVE